MKLTRAMTRVTEKLMCSGALGWGEGEGRWFGMASKLGQGGRNLPSESSGNGHEHERGHTMNARQNDVLREVSARAHADAEPVAKRAAGKLGVTPRTARRYANSGPPAVKEFFLLQAARAAEAVLWKQKNGGVSAAEREDAHLGLQQAIAKATGGDR